MSEGPGPATQPPPPGVLLNEALPLSLAEPGLATAGSSLLEFRRGEGVRLSQAPWFWLRKEQGRGRCTHLFLRLAWVPPPGRESFGLGLKGTRGERTGATRETAPGCRSQVSGQPRAAQPSPKASGGPPPLELQTSAQPEREG